MWDDYTKKFYDVDYETPQLGNTTPWPLLRPETIQRPTTVFPPEQRGMLEDITNQIATGYLVSVSSSWGGRIRARRLGRVNLKLKETTYMSWPALEDVKGAVLAAEMMNALTRHLWDRQCDGLNRPFTYKTPRTISDNMPRRWHVDGSALTMSSTISW
jgi:hypothetical protein